MNNWPPHPFASGAGGPWVDPRLQQIYAGPGAHHMGPLGPGMQAMGGPGPWMAGPMAGPMAMQATGNSSVINQRFVTGLMFGAMAAYLLTNETVQQGAINGAVKAWSVLQGGLEEMKERFRDAEAELHAQQAQDGD